MIEQATMLGEGQLLWVQVHGDSVRQASEVLRTVDTGGFSPLS